MLVVQCQDCGDCQHSFESYAVKTIDLIPAHKLLQTAAEDMVQLRRSFYAVLNETFTIASTWGLPRQFLNKRVKKTKAYFDEIPEGITFSDPEKRFCTTVFLPMMDRLYFLAN